MTDPRNPAGGQHYPPSGQQYGTPSGEQFPPGQPWSTPSPQQYGAPSGQHHAPDQQWASPAQQTTGNQYSTGAGQHSGPSRVDTDSAGGAHAYERPAEDLGQPLSNIGQIVSNITEDLSTLVRQETELAKAEIKQSATRAGKGAGLFGGAGVAGHMALLFLSIALWWGIAHLIESFGWAALIVGVLWAIAAAVMAAMGRKEINSIKGLERTAETASKIPDALKGNETTNG